MRKIITAVSVCYLLGIGSIQQVHAEKLIESNLQDGSVILYAKDQSQGFLFSPQQVKNRYFADFIRWGTADIGNIPQKDATLFIGSSSMRMWRTIKKDLAPLNLIHRGFGGSTMWDVMKFKNFFQRYEASRIIVYEGDNDLWNSDPDSVSKFLKNCRDFAAYIHETQPDVPIYFMSPKPCVARWSRWDKYKAAGDGLKKFAEETPNIFYIDVATPMLEDDGTVKKDIFLKDNLHMNSKGYEIWTKVVREQLNIKN